MNEVTLRGLAADDLPALLALQHATAGQGVRWTAGHLDRMLHDPAHAGGSRVVVADRGGEVVGGAGWVEAGAQLFGSPVLAADTGAARALVDHLIGRARAAGAELIRISATPLDRPKHEALSARGFVTLFDFVTLARPSSAARRGGVEGVRRAGVGQVPVEVMRDLYNETFAGVPNAPALDDAGVRHELAGVWPEGSGVWLDAGGAAVGFVFATRERDGAVEHAAVDSVGVRSSWRGRGIGATLVSHLVAAAAAAGLPEVRALIASTNVASLRLHESLGFAERSRITVWQLALPVG